MTRPLILYHGPECTDGFTAAWVVWLKSGDTADYEPVNYGQEPPVSCMGTTGGRDIFIVDFSYPRETLLKIVQCNCSVTVLDHHKTAQKDLDGLTAPGLSITFDMEKSGARLTWERFFPDQLPPWIVNYVQDRDLWLWKLPHSKEVSAGLASLPKTFEQWDWSLSNFTGILNDGRAILRYQQQLVDTAVKNASEIEIDGHKILAVNTTCLASEIGERLAAGRAFGATYFIHADGRRIWSLRSREGGIDVSEVAKRHGGGGHRAASGFSDKPFFPLT